MNNRFKKPLAAAIGAGFLATAALPVAAGSNPFTVNPLNSGYDLVSKANAEGKCGEGKCGEGKCGDEKKCDHAKPKLEEAKPAAPADKSASEGKCGEGMCGSM